MPARPAPQGGNPIFIIGTILGLVVTEGIAFLNGTIERSRGAAYMLGASLGVLFAVLVFWLVVFGIARIFGKARTGAGKVQIAFWVTGFVLLSQLAVLYGRDALFPAAQVHKVMAHFEGPVGIGQIRHGWSSGQVPQISVDLQPVGLAQEPLSDVGAFSDNLEA